MHRGPLPGLLLAVALSACARALVLAPPSPPSDPRERHRAEVGACQAGGLPRWLDDDALAAAIRTDRRELSASVTNDSFHGATFSPQPPPPDRAGPRTAAVQEGRQAFQRWCAGVRGGARPAP